MVGRVALNAPHEPHLPYHYDAGYDIIRPMETPENILPVRRRLPHTPPICAAAYAVGAPFFITICIDRAHYGISGGDVGRMGPLTQGNVAVRLVCELEFHRAGGVIHPYVATVMPDHLHFIASFREGVDMAKFIRDLKRRTAREIGIVWQDGFFDHRPRNDAELAEKSEYVLANPVRRHLCETADSWPFSMRWPHW